MPKLFRFLKSSPEKTVFFLLLLLFSFDVKSKGYDLDDLLSIAMVSYPEIVSRQQDLDAADTDLTAAKLQFLPTISLSTQRNQVQYSANGPSSNNLPASNATVTQPVFMGGKLLAGHDKAKANFGVAEYSLIETRENVAKRMVTAYAEWRRSYEKIQALEHSVRIHEKLLNTIAKRHEMGVAAGIDKDLVMARLNEAAAELDAQKSAENDSLIAMSQLIGQPVTRNNLTVKRTLPVKIQARSQVLEKVINGSPQIRRMQFEADAAQAYADEIRSQTSPQVYLQAQRQVGNAYTPGWPAFNQIGVVVQYSPGAGLSSYVSTSAANTKAQALRTKIESAKRDIAVQVNADVNEYETAQLKREKLTHSVTLTKKVSESYDRQYLVGKRSWLDLMNSVREEVQNMMAMADADASLLGSGYRIRTMLEAAGY